MHDLLAVVPATYRSASLLGEDQLVLAGQAQPVDFATVMDDDFARSNEQVAALEFMTRD